MACNECFKDWVSCGETGLAVNATLAPSANYTWLLHTPQGAVYHGHVTTDADGAFILDTTTLPAGLLNPYAGTFSLEVQTGNCGTAYWNDSAYCTPFSCIDFDVKTGNSKKTTLGCPCLGEVTENCYPVIISFTDVETLEIPYTAAMVLKYGGAPTVQVWIYDELDRLVNTGITVMFDDYPATLITADFGGISSGIIVIR